jgi:hypothetical protein
MNDLERRMRHFARLDKALDQGQHPHVLAQVSDPTTRVLARFVVRSTGFENLNEPLIDVLHLWNRLDPNEREELISYLREEVP